jgi:hypothetical protein
VSESVAFFWFPCEDPTADHKSDHGTSTTVKFFLKKEILGNGIHKPVDDAQIRGGYRYLTKAWGRGRPPFRRCAARQLLGIQKTPLSTGAKSSQKSMLQTRSFCHPVIS